MSSTEDRTVMLRPVATSLPLGFLGLMVSSVTYAAVQLGWLPASESQVAGLVALFVTVPLQLLAAGIGFWARDAVAATGMGVQAGLWAVTGLVTLTSFPGSTTGVFGVFLVAAAAALFVPAAAGLFSKPLASLVFLGTAIHSVVLAVNELTALPVWRTTAGIVGLVLGALAFYAALAFELEGARGRPVLPVGRTGPGQESGEPGVRAQL